MAPRAILFGNGTEHDEIDINSSKRHKVIGGSDLWSRILALRAEQFEAIYGTVGQQYWALALDKTEMDIMKKT